MSIAVKPVVEIPDEAEEHFYDAEERQYQEFSAFRPVTTERHKHLSKEDVIREVASSNLRKKEKQAGYLYILYDPHIPGLVKIGHASDVALRLRHWKRHCNHDFVEF